MVRQKLANGQKKNDFFFRKKRIGKKMLINPCAVTFSNEGAWIFQGAPKMFFLLSKKGWSVVVRWLLRALGGPYGPSPPFSLVLQPSLLWTLVPNIDSGAPILKIYFECSLG